MADTISVSGSISAPAQISGAVATAKTVTVYEKNYENLDNLPKINGETLIGDKSSEEIGIKALSNMDIERLLNNFV